MPLRAASAWQHLAAPVFVRADTRELPESAVMSLAQDSAGFLWVGTQGGLARFDGYHFRSFLPNVSDPKALPDGYVRAMAADTGGGIWIGSSSNGLVHFDAATEAFHTWHPDRTGRSGPRSASVDALAIEADGGVLVGGDGGLDRFDPHVGAFAPLAIVHRGAQPVVWSVLVDRAGTIWAGTQNGLYYRAARASRFRAFRFPPGPHGGETPVYSLSEDRTGHLWGGSTNALFVVDPSRRAVDVLRSVPQDVASLAPGQQWAISEITPGVMWAGTDGALSMVDATTRRVRRIAADPPFAGGFTSGRLAGFLRDRSGLVWVANHVGGLLVYNPMATGLYHVSGTRSRIGLGDKGAIAVAAAAGSRLWAGGFGGHIAQFDARSGRVTNVNLHSKAAVQALSTGADGTLWIGTTTGLCRLGPGAVEAICPTRPSALATQSTYAILAEGRRLWVGGSAGLFEDDTVTGTAMAYPRAGALRFSNGQVRVLYRDRRHRLWAGTENGLYRLDADGRIARFVFSPGRPDSIGPGGMAALLEDRRGRIWAGANGGPLDVLEEDRSGKVHVRRIGLADGMPHENVDGLAEDARGRIWAATDRGIALIDPDTLHARALAAADGVSEGAFWAGAVTQSTDGTIFFGGVEGVTIVAPNAASPWIESPPVVVSAIRLGRRTVPAWQANRSGATVELAANARDINVEFSALDYSAPQALRYAYKLDGYDRDWIEVDSRHRVAAYTHLSPGTYTLDVRGTNRLGVWSTHELHLGIRALPAWYETWWFRLLIGAVILFGAYGAYRARTAVMLRRQRELEGIVSERTRELSEANVKLVELSLSDPLTGLRNRRFLAQHLEADIALTLRRYEEARTQHPADLPQDADVLFFLVDLDHLKIVNDRHGHHAGDLVLVQMRDRLQEVFRDSDFVVRWGGDEFLTVARDSHRSEAGVIAERICEAVASRPFSVGGELTMPISVSVGFAAFPFVPSAPDAVSWDHVVGLADHALYMAKNAGRNAWFGLTATGRTDPEIVARRLEGSAEDLVRDAHLDIVTAVFR